MNKTERSGRNISVAVKLLASVVVVLLLVMGLQAWLNISSAIRRSETGDGQHLLALYSGFNDEVTAIERGAATLSLSLADRADIQDLFNTL